MFGCKSSSTSPSGLDEWVPVHPKPTSTDEHHGEDPDRVAVPVHPKPTSTDEAGPSENAHPVSNGDAWRAWIAPRRSQIVIAMRNCFDKDDPALALSVVYEADTGEQLHIASIDRILNEDGDRVAAGSAVRSCLEEEFTKLGAPPTVNVLEGEELRFNIDLNR